MHLGILHRAPVVAAAVCGAALVAVGAGPSRAGGVEANVVSPPFAAWGPSTERVWAESHGHRDYSAEIHYDLGLYFYEMGEYELSLKHYRRALELDPDFAEAYFGVGLLFYSLGDDENAITYYRRSLEKNPRDADTRNNLGLIYYRRGELEAARREIEEAVRLQPRFPDALYNLGLVCYQQADLKTAIANFLSAISQDPDYLRARFNLGVVYFELGQHDLAEEQWASILESAPGTPLADQATENLTILRSAAGR